MYQKNDINPKEQSSENNDEFEIILSKSEDLLPAIRFLIGDKSQYKFYKMSKISRKMVHRVYTDDSYKMRSDVLIKIINSLGKNLIIRWGDICEFKRMEKYTLNSHINGLFERFDVIFSNIWYRI